MPVLPDLGTWPYKQALFDAVAEVFVDDVAGEIDFLDGLLAATDWDSADEDLKTRCIIVAVTITAAVTDDFDRSLFGSSTGEHPPEKGELGPNFPKGQFTGPLRNIMAQAILEKCVEESAMLTDLKTTTDWASASASTKASAALVGENHIRSVLVYFNHCRLLRAHGKVPFL